jgi:hypothetical protein
MTLQHFGIFLTLGWLVGAVLIARLIQRGGN